MKSTNCLLIAIIFAGTFFSSCKKEWYEVEPDDRKIILDKLEDFEKLLDNNSMFESSPALGEIAADGHRISEQDWQTLQNDPGDGSVTQRNAYTWSDLPSYKNVTDYEYAYARIRNCNLVLQGLKEIGNVAPAEKDWFNKVKGNALFHRAKNNFDLCQLYAPPYLDGENNSAPGIVLKKSAEDPSELSVQSTVRECYDDIIEDLSASLDLLPLKPEHVARGSKLAAYALLARTYLVMQQYEQAGIYADRCLNNGIELMDYNTIPADTPYLGMFNKEVLFYSQMMPYDVIGSASFIEPELLSLYDAADLRRSRFFEKRSDGTVIFKGNYTNNKSYRFSGLASDELYLIRAECYARANQVTEALRFINELLRSRWDKNVTFIPYTPVSPAAALEIILLERKKELLYRGLRWSDMRRNAVDTITREIGGAYYQLDSKYKFTFPFPVDVLELAPRMKQHPGWH